VVLEFEPRTSGSLCRYSTTWAALPAQKMRLEECRSEFNFWFFLAALGFELRAPHLLGSLVPLEPLCQLNFLVCGILFQSLSLFAI
jgi:hypothetical protein